MKSFCKTDIGIKRSMNQDSMFCSESAVGSFHNLFIVADGMGGHKAGDQASKMCIEKMIASIEKSSNITPVSIMEEALRFSNKAVYDAANEKEEYQGMGTTVVAATIQDDTLYVANIGDSRLYLLREEMHQITSDHSLVEELVKKGDITESEARIHPKKNVITRALGIDPDVTADFFEVSIQQGDVILLCSDGLSNMLEDEDMSYIVKHAKDLEDAGNTLIERANQNGGNDNITAVIVQI